jgi:hypothetical protein
MDPINPTTPDDNDVPKARRRRRRFPIIRVSLLLVFVGALVAIFGFNVFNIRDGYIWPPLRGLPLVGQWIPGADEDYYGENGEAEAATDPAAELRQTLTDLERERDALQRDVETLQGLQTQQDGTSAMLRQYQADARRLQSEVNALQAQLDAVYVARDIEAEYRRFAAPYLAMSANAFAPIVVQMMGADPELLIRILSFFNDRNLASLFARLEPHEVTMITLLRAPDADFSAILPNVPVIGPDGPIEITGQAFVAPIDLAEDEVLS